MTTPPEIRGTRHFWQRALPGEDGPEGAAPGFELSRFEGCHWVIGVQTLRGKDVDPIKAARAALGALIAHLLHDITRAFHRELDRCYIFTAPPATPAVVFTLGDVVLYAQAASNDRALAEQRAVDRLAIALSLMATRDKPAFTATGVSVRRKG